MTETLAPARAPDETPLPSSKPAFLRRVQIRGYKSIGFCDVTLEPLTILVGRNASGKSNFLDAMGFVRDVIKHDIDAAVNRHGGHDSVCHMSHSDRRVHIDIDYMDKLGNGPYAPKSYQLSFEVIPRQPIRVIRGGGLYEAAEHLALFNMLSYNFIPAMTRAPQRPSFGWLDSHGGNLASVLTTLNEFEPDTMGRIRSYLRTIASNIDLVGSIDLGHDYETIQFKSFGRGGKIFRLEASSMSDGTLRALSALAAAFQTVSKDHYPNAVAIEEPETSLHPAAMHALVDALDEATLRTQILLTTHSVEMLDNPTIKPENIRVVQMVDGQTVIAPVDAASVEIVKQKLGTLGDLERDNQLEPDTVDVERQRKLSLNGRGAKE